MKYVAGLWLVACAACSSPAAHVPDAAPTADAAAGAPDPAKSSLTTSTDTAVVGTDQVLITVTVRDRDGMPLTGVAVQLDVTGGGTTLSPPALTNASGVTTSVLTSTIAETKQLTAVAGSATIGMKTVTFIPGPADQLVFLEQPATTVVGAPIAPAVAVAAEDTYGNIDTTVNANVTMSLDSTTVALAGTTSVAMSAGIATFAAIHVDVPGTYQLRAKLFGVTDRLSTSFDVLPGDPDPAMSTITAAPTSLEADGVETATLTAHLVNAYGIPLSSAPLTFAASGTNNVLTPGSGTTDANGMATAGLASTTPEVKTVTAVVGTVSISTLVHFYGPSCVPQLPGPPGVPLVASAGPLLVTDIDGDGHVDAIVGEPSLYTAVYRGRGDGTFESPINLALGGEFTQLAAGDFDHDGTPDLVIAVDNSNVLDVALGTGGGHFATPTQVVLPAYATHIVLGDFNRDGNLDIAASMIGQLVIELGAGNGMFTSGQLFTNIRVDDLVAADVDADGKLDLLYDDNTGVAVLQGQGNGMFAAAVASAGAGTGTLLVGDFNGDGTLDCAVANRGWTLQPYLGNGDGTFTAVGSPVPTGQSGSATTGIADPAGVVDVDGDGNVDLVLGEGQSLTIMKGAGDGRFALSTVYAPDTVRARVADMDEDGVADIVTLGRQLLAVTHGQPGGTFVAPAIHAEPTDLGQLFMSSADFDGNGQRDLVIQTTLGTGALLAQPDGSLTDAALLAESSRPSDLGAADVTGDGIPDLVGIYASSSGQALRVAVGHGDGTFAPFTTQVVAPLVPTDLHFADLDRDGKQDLVVTSDGSDGFWLLRSQGDGTFGAPVFKPGADFVVTTDVNGDGVTDVIAVITRAGYDQVTVELGDGAGGLLPPSSAYEELDHIGSVIAADIDGDGRGDLVLMEGSVSWLPGTVVVRRGLPTGDLATSLTTPVPGLPTGASVDNLAIADVTGDGALDLLIRSTNYDLLVLPGYGDGYFRQRAMPYSIAYSGTPGTFVIADDNRDMRADVAFWRGFGVGIAINRGCVP